LIIHSAEVFNKSLSALKLCVLSSSRERGSRKEITAHRACNQHRRRPRRRRRRPRARPPSPSPRPRRLWRELHPPVNKTRCHSNCPYGNKNKLTSAFWRRCSTSSIIAFSPSFMTPHVSCANLDAYTGSSVTRMLSKMVPALTCHSSNPTWRKSSNLSVKKTRRHDNCPCRYGNKNKNKINLQRESSVS